jgi:hypothetical protein
VGEGITAWAELRTGPFVNGQPTGTDLTETVRPLSLIMGTVEDGFDATDEAARSAREGFATGIRHGAAFGVNFLIGAAASGGNPVVGGLWAGAAGTAGSVLLQVTDGIAHSAPGADITGGQLEGMVIDQLRQDLATVVANQHGAAAPQPGEYSATLGRWRPDLRDALDNLDRDATDQRHDYRPDEDWSSR